MQVKLDYRDVLIKPKRSALSSREFSLKREFKFLNSNQSLECVPIIAANMDTVATFEIAKALAEHDCMTALHKFYSEDEIKDFFKKTDNKTYKNTWISIGASEEDLDKAENIASIYNRGNPFKLCIDVANGYQESFVKFVELARKRFPSAIIMAGNICTKEMAEQLIISGADIARVGIGSGSVCHTRRIAGVGYPQLSAVIECADAAHGLGGHICADGGCEEPGDVAKAFGAGADFVMLGGLLAGHIECGAPDSDNLLKFRGMSSKECMIEHYGKMADYRASEGKTVYIKCKGSVHDTIKEIFGGVRSAMTYIGAKKLKEMSKRTEFVLVKNILNKMFN